jgi:hypothetical protein
MVKKPDEAPDFKAGLYSIPFASGFIMEIYKDRKSN